jgi:Uma2 family endonuclease
MVGTAMSLNYLSWGQVRLKIMFAFGDYERQRRENGREWFVVYNVAHLVAPNTLLTPDVSVTDFAAMGNKVGNSYIHVAPTIAVEVVNRFNLAAALQAKRLMYFKAGTPQVWNVYPDTEIIEIHHKHGSNVYRIDDTISGGDVLPGFTLPVRDIFPK